MRFAHSSRFANRILPGIAVALVAACDPSTGPATVNLDVTTALADYQALERTFSSDGWAAFRALGRRSPLARSAGSASIASLGDLQAPRHGQAFVMQLLSDVGLRRESATTFAETLISNTYRGKTFVYNGETDDYEVDPARSGAPATGVRFVLYDVGPNGRPQVSKEIGYADLTDEGTPSGAAVALRLVAVEQSTTLLDYRLRVEPIGTGGSLDVSGFVRGDDGKRLDFTIGAKARQTNGKEFLDLEFTLQMADRGFKIVGAGRGLEEKSGDGTITLNITHGDQSARVEMEGKGGQLDGAIAFNGKPFVTIRGPSASPILRNTAGNPPSGKELLVVLAVVDVVSDVFDLVEDLVQPVDNLIVLGWIL
jgi:hypothetical protein